MNKLAVTIAATAALVVGPVAFAAAQVDAGRLTAQADASASASASESESMEPSDSAEPSESAEPSDSPSDSPSASESSAPDHTFTHGLPGALAGSATPGPEFGKYVSGLNRTGAPGAVASVMGKGKGHH